MFKDHQLSRSHQAAGSRVIEIEHSAQRLPEEIQILLRKAGALRLSRVSANLRENRVDEAVRAVQTIRNGVFFSKVPWEFLMSFSPVNAWREMVCSVEKIGSTERAKVSWMGPRTWPQFELRHRHNCSKSADIEEVFTHPSTRQRNIVVSIVVPLGLSLFLLALF